MRYKICKKCKIKSSTEKFYKQQQIGPNGQVWYYFDSYCKTCRLKYSYDRRKDLKRQAVNYLGGKCENCGIKSDRVAIYDFHHKNPDEKDFTIAKQSKSLDKIKSELDKCKLLCANCHRLEHDKY